MSSFWQYVFDNAFKQRDDIEEARLRARRNARRATRFARRVEDHLAQVEERLEQAEGELGEMRLFTRALLALLQENGTLDPARIRDKILEIDASDGAVDGRYDPPASEQAPPSTPGRRG